MFDYDPPKPKEPVDYTGLKIGLVLAPVFFLFVLLGNADMGLTVCIVLAVIIFAVKLRWNLRKHVWFWAIIALILALHVPLFLVVRWPQGKGPTLFYTMAARNRGFPNHLWSLGSRRKTFPERFFFE